MTLTVAELDSMPAARAAELLTACCGSTRWVERMVERRPFASIGALRAGADDVWRSLEPRDWREAFSHHPRIGERVAEQAQDAREARWSAKEQAGMSDADASVRQELAAANQGYEQRFGYVYIVCATGRSAREMLDFCRQRMHNDPETELAVAAEEQRKIMQIRLGKLFAPPEAA
jgi:OHCU decarboxylase